MRAAIINPYFDTLGGGERYSITFADVLSRRGWNVDVEWRDASIKEKLENRFGMNLDGVNFVKNTAKGDGYDLCFWVSDGSIPLMHARNNILHFQVPFHGVNGKSLLNKMKFFRINKVICNSNFTKEIIDKEFGIKSIVIYPPVDMAIKSKRKEDLILSVGRFSQILQSKGQDVLIKAFRKMFDGKTEWKLVLAGGSEIGAGEYIQTLKNLAKDTPIEIVQSPDFKTLKELYGKAKIFWSASGFGINEEKSPERVEHFGITVVEAMAAGAVPVITNSGGHKEIVNSGTNGYLWNKTSDLIKRTKELISDPKLLHRLSSNAVDSCKKYSQDSFEKSVVSNVLLSKI